MLRRTFQFERHRLRPNGTSPGSGEFFRYTASITQTSNIHHHSYAMKKVYRFLAVTLAVVGLILAFGTYFLVSTSDSGNVYDIWGRRLYESPFIMKMAGLSDYPGIFWFFVDFVIAAVLVWLIAKLWSLGQEKSARTQWSTRD